MHEAAIDAVGRGQGGTRLNARPLGGLITKQYPVVFQQDDGTVGLDFVLTFHLTRNPTRGPDLEPEPGKLQRQPEHRQ